MTSPQTDYQGDWFPAAAAEAMLRLETSLGPQVKRRHWKEFAARLNPEMENLFRLVHRLYGWRYDFAWILERLVGEALAGYGARPAWVARTLARTTESKARPEFWAALDAALPEGPDGSPDGLPDGLLDDLVDRATATCATHLHLEGSLPDKTICRALREAGLGLVADIDLDHVDSSHIWAMAATAGSQQESGYFFFFPDRAGPDAYTAGMRWVGGKTDGDAFSWHPEVAEGRWIWTTHDPQSWDLDYRNPELLASMVGRLIAMANRGVSRICMRGLPYTWKAAGTSSINAPEAHLVVQILGSLVRVASPWVSLVAGSEPASAPHLPPHERFIAREECSLGYDVRVTAAIWEALTAGDARILRQSIVARYPTGCYRVVSLRNNPGHPLKIQAGPLAFQAGLRVAVDLGDRYAVDLAARRTLAALAMLLAIADVPEIALEDAIGTSLDVALSDLALSDSTPSPVRTTSDDRLGPEGLLLSGLARLTEARRASARFVQSQPIRLVDWDDSRVLVLIRGGLAVLVNLSGESVAVGHAGIPPELDFDLIRNGPWVEEQLAPYAFRYLVATNSAAPSRTAP